MTSPWARLAVVLTVGLLAVPLGVEAQPGAKVARLGILNSASPPPPGQQSRYVTALGEFGWVEGQNLTVVRRDAYGQVDRLPALAAELVAEGVDVILAPGNPTIAAARQVTTTVPFVGDGGLMSYAPSLPDQYRRATRYVDRIFRGARPGDLPVEQPTGYDLVVNLKNARALGLVIPPAVMARADETIGA